VAPFGLSSNVDGDLKDQSDGSRAAKIGSDAVAVRSSAVNAVDPMDVVGVSP
jgi:hypothetical protein